MPSAGLRIESFREFSDDGLIMLVDVDHADLPEPLHLAWYDDYVTSNGVTYSPFPMIIELPAQTETNPTFRITLYGPAVDLVPLLRNITEPLDVSISIVRIKDPDSVEVSITNLVTTTVEYGENVVIELTHRDNVDRRFPKDAILPTNVPGSFP